MRNRGGSFGGWTALVMHMTLHLLANYIDKISGQCPVLTRSGVFFFVFVFFLFFFLGGGGTRVVMHNLYTYV